MWTVKKIYVMFMCINACISEGSSRDYFQIITNAVDWNSANKQCSNKNGTLVRIIDLGRASNLDKLKLAAPFWSSVTGFFTPWIAYRGCFPQAPQSTSNIRLSLNTVGQCFSHCKAHLGRNCTYFALQGDQCFCLCNYPKLPLADSNKCNITCNNSTEDGYCGGKQHMTLYEVRDEHRYRGDGFCLAYSCTSHERVYLGEDCDEQHEGFCVNRSLKLEVQSRKTWNGYAAACKKLNYFLPVYIESTSGTRACQGFVWNGVRSYKYDNLNGTKHCYKITLESEALVYKKAKCLSKFRFVCRTFLPLHSPDTTLTPNTEQSENQTNKGSSRDYFQIITNAVDWNSANKLCSNKNGTLVRIKDLGRASNLDKLKLAAPFWSSVTGFFTPWIAYRGCFPQAPQSTSNISLSLNTVGQCFSHCKAHLGRNCTYFALQEDQCFCLCNQPQLPLADSNKCNITCNNSTEDGYCGGKQHITLYEVRDEHLYRGDGFCLAYNCTSHERVYIGRDCDEQHEGFCVNRQLELKVQSRNIWNGYSAACKRLNYYLTAHIESTSGTLPYKGFAWIGVRSYKYDNFNGNPDTTVTPNTEQSKNPTNKAVGLVAGSVTGALILLTATFLTILFVRKKRKARNHMPPTVQNVLYELSETGHIVDGQKDAIYINGVVKNTNSTQCTSQDADHTYIDRSEGEYDRLHTSFPKTCTNEESHYDRSDSTYSTTTRDEHTDKVYGSHYDSMASLEKNTYDSKPNEHNKVYGSHYDSMTSLEENTYDSKPNEHSNVYGSHYDTMASLEENSS
ncbi:uncharacterized protein LOC125672550 isoform X2 [Ostrea edulis]|uniref:uncharacterized protein LOC125672550 isoform X2 n=1 Tax=Ostrea edulis TaxID=37623 RepID=UPI0024AF069F|nr:uncharacterized protein LOC125672550 isoform X2 [Ostrea edulis]